MAEDKVVVTLDSFEQRLLVSALTDFRNELLREEKPTEDVDTIRRMSSTAAGCRYTSIS